MRGLRYPAFFQTSILLQPPHLKTIENRIPTQSHIKYNLDDGLEKHREYSCPATGSIGHTTDMQLTSRGVRAIVTPQIMPLCTQRRSTTLNDHDGLFLLISFHHLILSS